MEFNAKKLLLSMCETVPVAIPCPEFPFTSARTYTNPPNGPLVNGIAFPLASKVKAEAVVTLFSGAMFAVTGLDGGLGANVLSPPYFAVRVYVPPGRLFTGEEADPFA